MAASKRVQHAREMAPTTATARGLKMSELEAKKRRWRERKSKARYGVGR